METQHGGGDASLVAAQVVPFLKLLFINNKGACKGPPGILLTKAQALTHHVLVQEGLLLHVVGNEAQLPLLLADGLSPGSAAKFFLESTSDLMGCRNALLVACFSNQLLDAGNELIAPLRLRSTLKSILDRSQ